MYISHSWYKNKTKSQMGLLFHPTPRSIGTTIHNPSFITSQLKNCMIPLYICFPGSYPCLLVLSSMQALKFGWQYPVLPFPVSISVLDFGSVDQESKWSPSSSLCLRVYLHRLSTPLPRRSHHSFAICSVSDWIIQKMLPNPNSQCPWVGLYLEAKEVFPNVIYTRLWR